MTETRMVTFTANSLPAYIELLGTASDLDQAADTVIAPDLARVSASVGLFYVHREDSDRSQLIVIGEEALDLAEMKGERSRVRLLERVDRVTREFGRQRLSIPPAWHKYQFGPKVAFFALPRQLDDESLRWIAEHLVNGDTCFWELTPAGNEKRLHDHVSDYTVTNAVALAWPDALVQGQALLPPPDPHGHALQPAVDLDVVGASAVNRNRPYSVWVPDLVNAQQQQILDYSGTGTLKVRGPAGTGKTLVLQLKAVREVYDAADHRSESPQILYLTHSWTLADLVTRSLRVIDERGLGLASMDVMPLTFVRELLYGGLSEGVEIIGDDSLEGKRQQMLLISDVVDDILSTDWPTYDANLSGHIADGARAESGTEARLVLCWMLMREFAEVIDANRLKPGLNALQRYLELPRATWMVDLPTYADREFVYAVYRRFVARLVDEGQLTTDQALDDFRKYLESYDWNLRRAQDGYDLILVDEFHLFNDTERYLMHLLTKDPDVPPRLILALDPQQSALALLSGLSSSSLSRQATENLQPEGESELVDLQTVHRFSKEVLEFVKLIYDTFPGLVDIGEDWNYDIDLTSSDRAGSRAVVKTASSRVAAASAALAIAGSVNEESPNTERTAVVAAGSEEFQALLNVLPTGEPGHHITVIQSRDDIDQLSYSRRSLVIGTAEYCAGLQFAHVVVLAFADRTISTGTGTSAARASLSELYLATTRAECSVVVVTSGDEGLIGQLLKRAVEQGIAEVVA